MIHPKQILLEYYSENSDKIVANLKNKNTQVIIKDVNSSEKEIFEEEKFENSKSQEKKNMKIPMNEKIINKTSYFINNTQDKFKDLEKLNFYNCENENNKKNIEIINNNEYTKTISKNFKNENKQYFEMTEIFENLKNDNENEANFNEFNEIEEDNNNINNKFSKNYFLEQENIKNINIKKSYKRKSRKDKNNIKKPSDLSLPNKNNSDISYLNSDKINANILINNIQNNTNLLKNKRKRRKKFNYKKNSTIIEIKKK